MTSDMLRRLVGRYGPNTRNQTECNPWPIQTPTARFVPRRLQPYLIPPELQPELTSELNSRPSDDPGIDSQFSHLESRGLRCHGAMCLASEIFRKGPTILTHRCEYHLTLQHPGTGRHMPLPRPRLVTSHGLDAITRAIRSRMARMFAAAAPYALASTRAVVGRIHHHHQQPASTTSLRMNSVNVSPS